MCVFISTFVFCDENKSAREIVCVFLRLTITTNYDCWSDNVLNMQHTVLIAMNALLKVAISVHVCENVRRESEREKDEGHECEQIRWLLAQRYGINITGKHHKSYEMCTYIYNTTSFEQP